MRALATFLANLRAPSIVVSGAVMKDSNTSTESFWDNKPHSHYRKHPRGRYRGHLWTKWLRPPSIKIFSAGMSPNSTGIDFTMTGITTTLSADISVNNPNYISAKLNTLDAEVIYPTEVARVPFGGGTLKDIMFNTNSQTNFTFLFDIDYQYKDDPKRSVLMVIANKCGILSSAKGKLNLEYKITANVRVFSFTINPSISNTLSVDCLIPDNIIQDIR
ncbi:epressed protein [Moniliophthora roreri]|nr:epressed protein [Moniliophthora roreri]